MNYANIFLPILMLSLCNLTEGKGYDCSKFDSHSMGRTLVECPPAKFMVEDNLVECFDNFTKIDLEDGPSTLSLSRDITFLNFNQIFSIHDPKSQYLRLHKIRSQFYLYERENLFVMIL